MNTNYSSRIKQILIEKELTVLDFCRLIGLNSSGTIHKLVNENRKPSSKTVDRIIEAFPEYTKDWLLYGIQEKKEFDNDDLTVTAKQVIDFIKNKSLTEKIKPIVTEKIKPIEIDDLMYIESELRGISFQLNRLFEFSKETERKSVKIIDRMINDIVDLLLIKITKYNHKFKRPKSIGNYSSRIKEIINDKELSVSDFCRLIGLNSPTTIHLLIKENRKPSSKTVDRILAAFPEYTKDWLLYGKK